MGRAVSTKGTRLVTQIVLIAVVDTIYRTVHEDKVTLNVLRQPGNRLGGGSLLVNLPHGHGLEPADTFEVILTDEAGQ